MKLFLRLLMIIFVQFSLYAIEIDTTFNWKMLNDSTNFYMEKSDFQTALKWAELSLTQTEKEFGKMDTNYLIIHETITFIYYSQSKFQEALKSVRIDSMIYHELFGINREENAVNLRYMGIIYTNLAMFIDAENRFNESLTILNNINPESTIEKAMCYNDLGSLYRKTGQYKEAEFYLMKALEIKKNLFGENSIKYSSALNSLALYYYENNKINESIKYFNNALEIIKELEGESKQYALICNNISLSYTYIDKYKDANYYIQKALEIRKKIMGSESIDYAVSLSILGQIKFYLGNYTEADSLIKQSIYVFNKYPDQIEYLFASFSFLPLIAEKKGEYSKADSLYNLTIDQAKNIYGDNHPNYFIANENHVNFYIQQLNFDKAKTLLDECRISRKKFEGTESVKILGYYADLYQGIGDYSKAEEFLLLSNSIILNNVEGENSPDYIIGLNNLAMLYAKLNKFEESELLYLKSLNLRKKNDEKNSYSVAIGLINLGCFYQYIGKYNEAEKLLVEGSNIMEIATGENSTYFATALNNLASLYFDIGQLDKGIELMKQTIIIDTINYGSNNNKLAIDYSNIAGMYSISKDFKNAEKYIKMSLDVYQSLTQDDIKYATVLIKAGNFYLDIADNSKAEKYYIDGIKIIEKLIGRNNIDYILPLNNLSIVYRNMARLNESKQILLDNISIMKNNNWTNLPDYKSLLYNLAATYRDLEDFKNADSTYNLAVQKSYDLLNNTYPYLSEIEKIAYKDKIQNDFYSFINYAINRYQNNNKIAAKFFDIQLSTKSKIFDYMKDFRTFSNSSTDSNIQYLNNVYINIKKEIGKLSTIDEKQLKNLGINLDSLVKITNDIEKELSFHVNSFAKINDKTNINWQKINNILSPNEVALELVRFPKINNGKNTDTIFYVALILKHLSDDLKSSDESQSIDLVLLSNGNELEEKYFPEYSRMIRDLNDEFKTGQKLSDENTVNSFLKEMYSQFWGKIQDKLDGIKTIYLSVDGIFNKINLNTLINPKTGKYLAEEMDIQIVTSTRDLVNRNDIAKNIKFSKTAELFGSPKFNLDSNEVNYITNKFADNRQNLKNSTSNNKLTRSLNDTLLRIGYEEIPGTKSEVVLISELLKSNNWITNLHTDKDASEESIKSINSPAILHIATHGQFDRDFQNSESEKIIYENPLLKSKLILAGAENTRTKLMNNEILDNEIEDGYLTAYEVMNMNLDNTELVVLSACETGLGEIRNGEGVYGLQRAFQVAGAKNLIMSLWKVPDSATQELMTNFYSKWLGGIEKRDAFRQAQMELAKKYPNFFYWGAWVFVGR